MTGPERNDHGWVEMGAVVGGDFAGASVSFAPLVPERRRCVCMNAGMFGGCHREATQEDLLCDGCRKTCARREVNR